MWNGSLTLSGNICNISDWNPLYSQVGSCFFISFHFTPLFIQVVSHWDHWSLFQGRPAQVGSTWNIKNINRTTEGHHTVALQGLQFTYYPHAQLSTVVTNSSNWLQTKLKVFSLKVFHEDGIVSGYRHPHSSATDCILSLFQLTNETLNIWTHFLPTWYRWQILFPCCYALQL